MQIDINTPPRPRRRLLRRAVGLGLATLVLIGTVWWGRLTWLIDRAGRLDQAGPADVIVVLGASVNADGSAGQDIIERVRHGVELYQAGWSQVMLFTGGEGPAGAARLAAELAAQQGVPDQAIIPVEGSWETRSDALLSAALMRERGWQTALIVTHPLHCYRAALFFRQAGIQAYISPTASTAQVPQPWRIYYTWREALGVIWPHLRLPDEWTAWLQQTVYGLAP